MGRPLKPDGTKARGHLATMDMDLAMAGRKALRQLRIAGEANVVTDPVQWNEYVRQFVILTSEIVQHLNDARLEGREVVEILDEWARLNNGDGP